MACFYQFVNFLSCILCFLSQHFIKQDILTAVCSPIIKGSGWDSSIQHFLQTNRLCTQLDHIRMIFFGFPPLVFDRKGLPDIREKMMKLEYIRYTHKTKPK